MFPIATKGNFGFLQLIHYTILHLMFIASKDPINLGPGPLGKVSNLEELMSEGNRQIPSLHVKAKMVLHGECS